MISGSLAVVHSIYTCRLVCTHTFMKLECLLFRINFHVMSRSCRANVYVCVCVCGHPFPQLYVILSPSLRLHVCNFGTTE